LGARSPEGAAFDRICVLFRILSGKSRNARAFQHDLDIQRKADYARSEQAIGITTGW
jgi:hypothetical protein